MEEKKCRKKRYAISCTDLPDTLLEKTNALNYFNQFGRVIKITFRLKGKSCVVDYDSDDAVFDAVDNGGVYENDYFTIRPFTRKVKKAVKEKDPTWPIDLELQAELNALAEIVPHQHVFRPPVLKESIEEPKKERIIKPEEKVRKPIVKSIIKNPSVIMTVKKKKPVDPVELDRLVGILKQVTHTTEEKYKILDARDKLIRLHSIRQTDIGNAEKVIGTCPDMCPEKERYLRESQHQVSLYEQLNEDQNEYKINHKGAIKQYSRSSADQEMPLPHELRPVTVLQYTMNYLLRYIINLCDTPDNNIGDWYHFVWDRTRGIRKDITQQQLCCRGSVELVEQCARFHIHCAARLISEDVSVFDPKINTENLTKCLQTLKYMYHDLGIQNIYCPNEAEFRGYIILLNLHDGNFMWEVKQLRREIQKSPEISFAIKVFLALDNNNFVSFFKLVRQTNYLNACLLLRYFNEVRYRSIYRMIRTHSPRAMLTQIPLDELENLLAFENRASLISFIDYHGLNLNETGTHVILDRKAFTSSKLSYELDRAVNIVETKREISVGEIISGKKIDILQEFNNHVPQNSFDEKGYFKKSEIPEQWIKSEHIFTKKTIETTKPTSSIFEKPPETKTANIFHKPIEVKATSIFEKTVDSKTSSSIFEKPIEIKTPSLFEKPVEVKNLNSIFEKPVEIKPSSSIFEKSKVNLFDKPVETKTATNIFDKPIEVKSTVTTSIFHKPVEIKKSGSIFDNKVETNNFIFKKPIEVTASNIFKQTKPENESTYIFKQPIETKSQTCDASKDCVDNIALIDTQNLKRNIFASQVSKSENIFGTVNKVVKTEKAPTIFQGTILPKDNVPQNYEINKQQGKSINSSTFGGSTKIPASTSSIDFITNPKTKHMFGQVENKQISTFPDVSKSVVSTSKVEIEKQKKQEEELKRKKELEVKAKADELKRKKELEAKAKEELKRKIELEAKAEIELREKLLEQVKQKREQKEREQIAESLLNELICAIEINETQQRLKQIGNNMRLWKIRYIGRQWLNKVKRISKKRKAVEDSPIWIAKRSYTEEANELYTPNQDLTLVNMKQYKLKRKISFIKDSTSNPINFTRDIFKYLKDRVQKIENVIVNTFYWKIILSIPDENECDDFHTNKFLKTLENAFLLKKKDDYLLVDSIKPNNSDLLNICLRYVIGDSLYASEKVDIIIFGINDTKMLHKMKHRLDRIIKVIQKQNIVIILRHGPNPATKDEIIKILGLEKLNYNIFIDNNYSAQELIHSVESGLCYLAKNVKQIPPLNIEHLTNYLHITIGNEFAQRLKESAKENYALQLSFTDHETVINLYNQAVVLLSNLVLKGDNYNYPSFPDELREYIPSFTYPTTFEYFPRYWKDVEFRESIEGYFKMLYLPQFNEWPPENITELEDFLQNYCNKIVDDKNLDVIFLKVLSFTLDYIEQDDNFQTQIENFPWIDLLQIFISYKINFISNMNSNYEQVVIYNKNDFKYYNSVAWWLDSDIIHDKIEQLTEYLHDQNEQSVTECVEEQSRMLEETHLEEVDFDIDEKLMQAVVYDYDKEINLKKQKQEITEFKALLNDLDNSMQIQKLAMNKFCEIIEKELEK